MEPLHHDPAGVQAGPGERVELHGEEVAHARHPAVGRVGDDHVVLLVAREKRVASVGDEKTHPRVREDVAILGGEELRRVAHGALDVRDLDRPHRVARRGGGRHAGAEAEDEDVARGGVEQHRQMPEQELVGHVAGVRRGVRLAVRAIEEVRALSVDRQRRRDTVLVEEELRGALGRPQSVRRPVDRGVVAGSQRQKITRPGRQQQGGGEGRGGEDEARAPRRARGGGPEGEHAGDGRRRRRQRERGAQAEAWDQDEPSEEGAAHRAERVPGRDAPDAAPGRREAGGGRDGGGKGDAEEDRERQEDRRHQDDLQRLLHREGILHRGKPAQESEGESRNECDADQRGARVRDEREAEDARGVGAAHSRERGAPDRDAAEKEKEDQAEGVDRAPEEEPHQARPRHLVHHGGESGERDRGEQHARGPLGCRRGRLHPCRRLRGLRPRRRAGVARESERHGAGEEIDRHGDELALAHAGVRQEVVVRGRGSGARAERVGGVEGADAAADLALAADEPARQDRKGAAHERAGHRQHQADEEELDDEEGHRRRLETGRQEQVDALDRPQKQGDREAEQSDQHFQDSVGPQRPVAMAVRPGTEQQAARRQAAHEGRENGRDGERRRAEDVREPPRPEDFVDQAARARQREDEKEHGPLHGAGAGETGHWLKDKGVSARLRPR